MNSKKEIKLDIPISSMGFTLFGFLIILFSFFTWFATDLQRLFIGIIGGSLIGFLGYFIYKIRKSDQDVKDKFEKLEEERKEIKEDIKAISQRNDALENKLIEVLNAKK